jgi:hypothetical protein
MNVDVKAVRRAAPYAAPLVVVLLAWVVVIRPAVAERARVEQQLHSLRARLSAAQRSLDPPVPEAAAEDPRVLFERQIHAGNSTSQLLGALTRLAMSIGARSLVIDSNGTRVAVAPPGTGPNVSGAADPDPRVALFEVPLAYSTVPLSFEGSYEAAGEFLWRFRDMPAAIEIRRLEIAPRPEAEGADLAGAAADARIQAPPDGTVVLSMTLFVYARQDDDHAAAGHHVQTPGVL